MSLLPVTRTTITLFLSLTAIILLSSLPLLTHANVDPCSVYTQCEPCAAQSSCGWCNWSGGCMTGTMAGPTMSTCYSPGGGTTPSHSNWLFASCTDSCYLLCGITCSSSQQCFVNRDGSTPQCSCETKESIVIGAVISSIFLFCFALTIFVIIRRRAALKHSHAQSVMLSAEWNNSYIPPGTLDGAPSSWTSQATVAAPTMGSAPQFGGGTSAQQQHDGYNQLR